MKHDPRSIYPGTTYYSGLTAPFGVSTGVGFSPSPAVSPSMQPPNNGGARMPPLASVFGQPADPLGAGAQGSFIR